MSFDRLSVVSYLTGFLTISPDTVGGLSHMEPFANSIGVGLVYGKLPKYSDVRPRVNMTRERGFPLNVGHQGVIKDSMNVSATVISMLCFCFR